MINKKYVSVIVVFLLTFSLITYFDIFASGESKKNELNDLHSKVESIIEGKEDNIAVFIGTADGEIAINEDKVYSSASTIKVPILMEALRQGNQGTLNLDEKVTITSDDITTGGGIVRQMSDDLELSVRDLAFLMIILSDNTTTNMMIDRVGMNSVNKLCDEIGCENTKLQRKMMENPNLGDNLTTAKDMGTILKEVYEGDVLNKEAKQEFLRIMGEQKLGTLSTYRDGTEHKGIKVYSKGGSLGSTGVRHDVGIITNGDKAAYVAVLTEDLSVKEARLAIAQIGESVMDYLVE